MRLAFARRPARRTSTSASTSAGCQERDAGRTSIGLPSGIATTSRARTVRPVGDDPAEVKPGTYHVSMQCSNGHSAVAEVTWPRPRWSKALGRRVRPGGHRPVRPAAAVDHDRVADRTRSPAGGQRDDQARERRFGVKLTIPKGLKTATSTTQQAVLHGASTVADLAVVK